MSSVTPEKMSGDSEQRRLVLDTSVQYTPDEEQQTWWQRNKLYVYSFVCVSIVIIAIAVPVTLVSNSKESENGVPLATTQSVFDQGQSLCTNARNNTVRKSTPNKDSNIISPAYLIRNALQIWAGRGEIYYNTDVLIQNGTIFNISESIPIQPTMIVIDATNKIVTPGLIDMHSHVGVYAQPELVGNSDGNEATNPIFPQLRAIDAFNPSDAAIKLILRGGITTSLVLPGSANAMGGEGFVVKHRGTTVAAAAIADAPRYMKWACGENVKNSYGPQGITPASRMGAAWIMRSRLQAALQLATQQDDWCATPSFTNRYPLDLSLDSLVALLRGSLILNVHCYTVYDMEMIIQLSKEFNFKIGAFHHAMEAWKIPETLAAEGITTATFADKTPNKLEAYDSSAYAPVTIAAANGKVAIKSDHPVVAGDTLMFEAAKTTAYGFDPHAALAAVTTVPAETLGLSNRIGAINISLDADLVIWDRSPFTLGAIADKVFLDGNLVVDNGLPAAADIEFPRVPTMVVAEGTCPSNVVTSLAAYHITNAIIYLGNSTVINQGEILVVNGLITCLDVSCPSGGATSFNLQGGRVIPGLVNVGNGIGLSEIGQEPLTTDGEAQDTWANLVNVRAIDGTQYLSDGRQIRDAFTGGVTVTVSSPLGSRLVIGQSSAFLTLTTSQTVVDDIVVKAVTGLHVNLGQTAKVSGTLTGSISGQIQSLRSLLASGVVNGTDPVSQVVQGLLPLVISASNADTIASSLRLKSTFPLLRLVYYGADEAWLVASRLAAANAAVILKGVHCFPDYWEAQRCPDYDTAASILTQAGVTVAIAPYSIDWTRNLRWEAGLARARGLSFDQALASVTSIPAALFGLTDVGTIQQSKSANFVAFNGDPFSFSTMPQLVAVGTSVLCYPRQR